MAKGSAAKEQIFEKMRETFEGSFMYNGGKELRINWEEESGPVQIKVTLTAAKDPVSIGEEVIKPAATVKETVPDSNFPMPKPIVEPTPEEKQNVEDLLNALGLN